MRITEDVKRQGKAVLQVPFVNVINDEMKFDEPLARPLARKYAEAVFGENSPQVSLGEGIILCILEGLFKENPFATKKDFVSVVKDNDCIEKSAASPNQNQKGYPENAKFWNEAWTRQAEGAYLLVWTAFDAAARIEGGVNE